MKSFFEVLFWVVYGLLALFLTMALYTAVVIEILKTIGLLI